MNLPSLMTSISTYMSSGPKYSFASLIPQILRIYSKKIFFCISISTYCVNQDILSHPWHHNFYVSTWPIYSFASLTPPFLHINSTKILFCIPYISISTYQLDQNILAHPIHLCFYLSSWPKYSFVSLTPPSLHINWTKIFFHILNTTSISMYLLNQNILSHPGHLHFYVSIQPRYSFASWTPPFLCI